MSRFKYVKEIQIIKASKVISRPELKIEMLSELIDDFQVNRHIYLSSDGHATKYDINNDSQYEMREYESHMDIAVQTIIDKSEFETKWAQIEYKNRDGGL